MENIIGETKRCKEIVNRKINSIIKYRKENIKVKSQRLFYAFTKLKRDIIFLFDNPNYKRKTKEQNN